MITTAEMLLPRDALPGALTECVQTDHPNRIESAQIRVMRVTGDRRAQTRPNWRSTVTPSSSPISSAISPLSILRTLVPVTHGLGRTRGRQTAEGQIGHRANLTPASSGASSMG
jgi:hypothetical protein